MKRYDIDLTGQLSPQCMNEAEDGEWIRYSAVYAEIARLHREVATLKAERDSFRDFSHKANDGITKLQDKLQMHKAALRWCLENSANSHMGKLFSRSHLGIEIEPPPEYAPLIAEALDATRGAK